MSILQKKLLTIEDYQMFLQAAWLDHLKPRLKSAPTVISTFAGCGGSSLGYSIAGFRELLAVEYDPFAAKTFRENFIEVPVYEGDIKNLTVAECLRLAKLKRGELDVLDGSPPCQGFSTSGKRKKTDQRNLLFLEYARLLNGLKPKVFVMENVSGLIKGGMKNIFAEMLKTFSRCGYNMKAQLCDAKYFGVAQNRKRIIVVGVRKDFSMIKHHLQPMFFPVALKAALKNVAPLTLYKAPKYVAEILSYVLPERSLVQCVPKNLKLKHIPRMYYNKKFSFGGIGIRPNISKQSPTITKMFICFSEPWIHPTEDRYPSIEEIAAVSSFPKQFQFHGNFVQRWGLIGNCVPPMFMRGIALQIKQAYFC